MIKAVLGFAGSAMVAGAIVVGAGAMILASSKPSDASLYDHLALINGAPSDNIVGRFANKLMSNMVVPVVEPYVIKDYVLFKLAILKKDDKSTACIGLFNNWIGPIKSA